MFPIQRIRLSFYTQFQRIKHRHKPEINNSYPLVSVTRSTCSKSRIIRAIIMQSLFLGRNDYHFHYIDGLIGILVNFLQARAWIYSFYTIYLMIKVSMYLVCFYCLQGFYRAFDLIILSIIFCAYNIPVDFQFQPCS